MQTQNRSTETDSVDRIRKMKALVGSLLREGDSSQAPDTCWLSFGSIEGS